MHGDQEMSRLRPDLNLENLYYRFFVPKITQTGIEFLQDNNKMQKAKNITRSI